MNKLLYSPEALNDLDEIWTYISNELQNFSAAQKIVSDILGTIENLQEFALTEFSLVLAYRIRK